MGRASLTFFCCVLAIPACTKLIPGIRADSLEHALLAGVLLGVCYLLLRPVLKLLTLPIGCLTLGTFGFGIDALMLWLLPQFIPGLHIDDITSAALAALLVNGVCMIAGGIR